MGSPRHRDSVEPSPGGRPRLGSSLTPRREGSSHEIQIDLTEAGADAFAPAIFLEQLLSEEPSPPPPRKPAAPIRSSGKAQGSKKKSASAGLKPPTCSEESQRTPSTEALLSAEDTTSVAARQASLPSPPAETKRGSDEMQPPALISKPSRPKKSSAEDDGPRQQSIPSRRTQRPQLARQNTAPVVGRPASRPRLTQAPSSRELAPWDAMPDTPSPQPSPAPPVANAKPSKNARAEKDSTATKMVRPRTSSRAKGYQGDEQAPTFGKIENRMSVASEESRSLSLGSMGSAVDVHRDRSPSLRDQSAFDFDTTAAKASPQKMTLSALQQAPRAPLLVRLARVHDLEDASISGSPLPPLLALSGFAMKPGPVTCEYKELSRQLCSQRVLGAQHPAKKALFWWYLPYVCAASLYLKACLFIAFSEYALAVLPLCAILVAAHFVRLGWFDRLLLAAVDSSAASDARAQLRPALGWDGEHGFSAMLMAALREISAPQGLLLAQPNRQFPRTPMAYSAVVVALLCTARLFRHVALGEDNGDEEIGRDMMAIEAGIAVLAVAVLILFGCTPRVAQQRALEADLRLAQLEAAFNAMLDALRPLLIEPPRELPPSQVVDLTNQAIFPSFGLTETTQLAHESFSVRLVTQQRLTLRATLQVHAGQEAVGSAMWVTCSVADFSIMASALVGFTPTDLGAAAAGTVEMLDNQHDNGIVGNTIGLSMSGWAAAVVSTRQRGDDDARTDVTASTASTLRSQGRGMKDEAAMHLAMGTVTALSHRRCIQPLEVFRACTYGAIVPPKTPDDEPALLLTIAADNLMLARGCDPSTSSCSSSTSIDPSAKSSRLSRWVRRLTLLAGGAQAESREMKDIHGVLRTQQEMRKLCSSGGKLKLAASSMLVRPRARSDASSAESADSEDDVNERRPITPSSPSKAKNIVGATSSGSSLNPPKHMALVFDTYSERNRCVALLQSVRLLPKEPGCG